MMYRYKDDRGRHCQQEHEGCDHHEFDGWPKPPFSRFLLAPLLVAHFHVLIVAVVLYARQQPPLEHIFNLHADLA